ncbi:MAG: hypothetical protein JXM73_18605 [Anaerolineae bacterium]|nr:hypothetical protein [Anaerolineae bacterium]
MRITTVTRIIPILTLVALLVPLGIPARLEAQGGVYVYFPSAIPSDMPNDGRMLSLGGVPLKTLAGQTMGLVFMVPEGSHSFEIGFFDGDSGKNAAGALNPSGGHWDLGTSQLVYELFADPLNEGLDQNPNLAPIATFYGNDANVPPAGGLWSASTPTMNDNAWWTATIATSEEALSPSGHFFYHMRVSLSNPNSNTVTNFKVRTTAAVMLHHSTAWGFEGAVRQPQNDLPVIYPDWNGDWPLAGSDFWLTTPTTYDGTWSFFLDVRQPRTELSVWDGDFDLGTAGLVGKPSGVPIAACVDSDDLNTPDGFLPPWAAGTVAVPEGAQGSGLPREDNDLDVFRRPGCIALHLTDPLGNVYMDNNPSGNMEWEAFSLTSGPAATAADADYGPPASGVSGDGVTFVTTDPLPMGVWRLDITGLDLSNLNFLKLPVFTLGVCEDGSLSCYTVLRPFLVGDTVWYDADGNGVQDAGELGIEGVIVNLLSSNGYVIATTTTNPDGHYEFEVDAGTYTVQVVPPAGLQQTFDPDDTADNQHTSTVVDDNVLTYDFGYAAPTSIGDLLWRDSNANGVFEPEVGELPLAGVLVDLYDAVGNWVASQTTGADGAYLFEGLAPGAYTAVIAGGIPGDYQQTYDWDGTLDGQTAKGLAGGEDFREADFGYRPATSPGTGTPGYWKNHPEAWPVGVITIGGVDYSVDAAIATMNAKSGQDKTYDLFRALVSAKLNVGLGNESSCIVDWISQADAWMGQHPVGSGVKASSSAWQEIAGAYTTLDEYNNGLLCAPHRG